MTTDQAYQDLLATAVSDFSAGNIDGFSEACKSIIAADSSLPESQFLIGIMAFLTDDPGLAVEKVQAAYDMDTECGTYADVLANLYARLGRLNDSLYFAKLSPTLEEHPILGNLIVAGLDNYMVALAETKLPEFLTEALRAYRKGDFISAITLAEKELRLDKREPETYKVLAKSYMKVGEYTKALPILRSWLHTQQDELEPRLYLTEVLSCLGQRDQAKSCLIAALQVSSEADLNKNYGARFGLEAPVQLINTGEGADGADKLQSTGFEQPKKAASAPLRIGIISDQFARGSMASVIQPWINAADDGIEVYCYHDSDIQDDVTRALKSKATKWSDIADIDDQTLLYIIDADGLDAIIDFSADWYQSREAVIANSNVAICLGGGNRTLSGAGAITHVIGADGLLDITDAVAVDRDKLVSAVASTTALNAAEKLDPKPFPMTQSKVVTFGADFDLTGMDSGRLTAWAGLLAKYPGSRLVLGNADFAPKDAVTEVCNLFGNFGLLDRLGVASNAASERGQMEFFDAIDIYLPSPVTFSAHNVMTAALAGRPSLVHCDATPQGTWVAGVMSALGQNQGAVSSWAELQEVAATTISDIEASAVTAAGFAKSAREAPALDAANVVAKACAELREARD